MSTLDAAMRFITSRPYTASCRLCRFSSSATSIFSSIVVVVSAPLARLGCCCSSCLSSVGSVLSRLPPAIMEMQKGRVRGVDWFLEL